MKGIFFSFEKFIVWKFNVKIWPGDSRVEGVFIDGSVQVLVGDQTVRKSILYFTPLEPKKFRNKWVFFRLFFYFQAFFVFILEKKNNRSTYWFNFCSNLYRNAKETKVPSRFLWIHQPVQVENHRKNKKIAGFLSR